MAKTQAPKVEDGLSELKNVNSIWERATKVVVPIAVVGGFVSDVLSPLGPFLKYLFIFACGICAVSAVFWFGVKKRQILTALADGKIDQREFETIVASDRWSVGFSFGLVATVVMGVFLAAQQALADSDRGVVADQVEWVGKLQNSLLRIENRTQQMAATLQSIDQRLAEQAENQGQASGLTVSALQTLAERGAWKELLDQAPKVSASSRDETWQELVQRAAVAEIQAPGRAPSDLIQWADSQLALHPHLTSNKTFMNTRADLGVKHFGECLGPSHSVFECNKQLKLFSEKDPKNWHLQSQLPPLVWRSFSTKHAAFPYFKAALQAAPSEREVSELCQHEYMVSTLSSALSAWEPSTPELSDVRQVAFKTCWKHLASQKDRIQELISETLDSDRGLQNSCADLLQLKALQGARANKCQRLAKGAP